MTNKERMRELYRLLRRTGRCAKYGCGGNPAPDRTMCKRCAVKVAKNAKLRYRKKKCALRAKEATRVQGADAGGE